MLKTTNLNFLLDKENKLIKWLRAHDFKITVYKG